MADVIVTCINKSDRNSSHEGITHLGNPKAEWKWTREQVIASIEAKSNTFYTLVDGNRGDIGVVNGPNGKYGEPMPMANGTITCSLCRNVEHRTDTTNPCMRVLSVRLHVTGQDGQVLGWGLVRPARSPSVENQVSG